MDFEDNKSGEHQHNDDIDHLPYLKEAPSIFEDENNLKMKERVLICAACDHSITTVFEKTKVRGRHDHGFRYYGHIVRLGCFRNAEGCIGVQGVSHGYSWFRGYSWQIQVCENCYTQLGWKYMSEEDSFYGLVFKTLREVVKQEDSGGTDNSK